MSKWTFISVFPLEYCLKLTRLISLEINYAQRAHSEQCSQALMESISKIILTG